MNKITVDFSKNCGKMKIMHAVNNGPAGFREREAMDNFDAYRELEIPYARNHDASFCHNYGLEHTVDVGRIFKNFDADVNDPASYDFEMTDQYIADTEEVGTRTFYRLGARIEHNKRFHTYPPKDYQKWAEICEHIIRHYTEGWADGFTYDMEYWEIWNEADGYLEDGRNACWQGTREQFIEFFLTVVRHLKSNFPHLQIGGPAFCHTWGDEYNDMIFTALANAGLTIDFFSFHGYCNEPSQYSEAGEHAYQLMEKYGLVGKTKLILNEWNYCCGWWGEDYVNTIRTIQGLKGSSFIAGTMCAGQKSKLDMMMYYDARPCEWNAMFDAIFLTPKKGYYPFKMYSQLYKMGTQVLSESDDQTLHHLAAAGENACGLMFTHFSDAVVPAKEVAIELKGCSMPAGSIVEIYLLDEQKDMALVRKERLSSEDTTLYLNAELYSTYYVKISKESSL